MVNNAGVCEMTTLTLNLPEELAARLAGTDQQSVLKALEIGLATQLAGGEGQATEHPHVTRAPGILNGRPIIRGSRIPVWQVAQAIVHLRETVENYLADHPHLTAAKIYDALSYYFDHREAIEKEIAENKTENLAKELGMTVDERGVARFTRNESSKHE